MQKMEMVDLKEYLEAGEVLLVVSPTAWTAVPMLGIHMLQAACCRAELSCGVLYSNLLYAQLIGTDLHSAVAVDDVFFMNERLFAAAAFDLPSLGHRPPGFSRPGGVPGHIWPQRHELPDITHLPGLPAELITGVLTPQKERFAAVDWLHLESLTQDWLLALARQIAGLGFRLIGCSTTHGGLAPAVALLKKIKEMNPAITTILGGAQCEGEMAEGLLSLNTGIDYIFSGEGEITFPLLVKKILADDNPAEKIIAGETLTDLDTAPLPEYHEYFQQSKAFLFPPPPPGREFIPYETSRGCRYGQCTFCGQKGRIGIFRKKSPDHILAELSQLVRGHGIANIYMIDNSIPPEYYDELFPRLKTVIPSARILFQFRAGLTFAQLSSVSEAGATLLQPGIETLSPALLRRMDKGVTLRDIIALLRYGRSLNLDLKWNLLFGFPGDQEGEYEEMLALFPLLHHLQPPDKMMPLRLSRYSRYQEAPGMFGIKNLRPAAVYKDILPAQAQLDKLAVFFTGEYRSAALENPALLASLYREYKSWRESWASFRFLPLSTLLPMFHLERKSPGEFILHDTRGIPGQPERLILDNQQAGLLLKARPWDDSPELRQALAAKWGIVADSWFIPLATAASLK